MGAKKRDEIPVVAGRNLLLLSESERVAHYLAVCGMCGLEPTAQPFGYYTHGHTLGLYAARGLVAYLIRSEGLSVRVRPSALTGPLVRITGRVFAADGRSVEVSRSLALPTNPPEEVAERHNRGCDQVVARAVLDLCGLGLPDETELADGAVLMPLRSGLPLPAELEATSGPTNEISADAAASMLARLDALAARQEFFDRFGISDIGELHPAALAEAIPWIAERQRKTNERPKAPTPTPAPEPEPEVDLLITTQQCKDLADLINRTKSDVADVCKYYGVKCLADFTLSMYQEAMRILVKKKEKKEGKKEEDGEEVKRGKS